MTTKSFVYILLVNKPADHFTRGTQVEILDQGGGDGDEVLIRSLDGRNLLTEVYPNQLKRCQRATLQKARLIEFGYECGGDFDEALSNYTEAELYEGRALILPDAKALREIKKDFHREFTASLVAALRGEEEARAYEKFDRKENRHAYRA